MFILCIFATFILYRSFISGICLYHLKNCTLLTRLFIQWQSVNIIQLIVPEMLGPHEKEIGTILNNMIGNLIFEYAGCWIMF